MTHGFERRVWPKEWAWKSTSETSVWVAYARQARFPALPRFRGALYFLRSEEQRSEQAKPKSEAGGTARRSSFILPPSPYSYNNTLRSCYNGGSLRSCSQPRRRRGRVRPPARQLACQPPRQLPLRAPYLSSILLPTAAVAAATATHPWPLPYPAQPAFSSRVPEPEMRSQDAVYVGHLEYGLKDGLAWSQTRTNECRLRSNLPTILWENRGPKRCKRPEPE